MKCMDCGIDVGMFSHYSGRCKACNLTRIGAEAGNSEAVAKQEETSVAREENAKLDEKERAAARQVLLTTETAAPDLLIRARLGIVTAEVVIGMHVFKDVLVGVRNTIGGRSDTYQKDLRSMRAQVLEELQVEAQALGANAVVAIDLDYQEIGSVAQSMLMLVASGTAVRLES